MTEAAAPKSYSTNITSAYIELRSIYVGQKAMKETAISPGRVNVVYEGGEGFSAEGNLHPGGILSGMAKLYKRFGLTEESKLNYKVTEDGALVILNIENPSSATAEDQPSATSSTDTVFKRQSLKNIHIEPFRAENLNAWKPETETDVYLAFGVLQEYTDYQYCCGTSSSLLAKLGYKNESSSKPDAILISRITDEYLMAEWKMKSSDFKVNHKPEDVDVVVCWIDDESDRTSLPPKTLALQNVAREAAKIAIQSD